MLLSVLISPWEESIQVFRGNRWVGSELKVGGVIPPLFLRYAHLLSLCFIHCSSFPNIAYFHTTPVRVSAAL